MMRLFAKWFGFVLLLAAFLLLAGCAGGRFDSAVSGPMVLTHSVQGRAVEYYHIGSGDDVVLIIGGIHGNEPASSMLAYELIDRLWADPDILGDRHVIVVPAGNPDGLAAGTRENARGVDLNRNFPAANRENIPLYGMEGFSEPESRALGRLKEKFPPNRIISIHQPLECIDFDGPGLEIAQAMARYCDLPVRQLGARPGSYGSYAGLELGVPIITYEMRRDDEQYSQQLLWQMYGKSIMAGIFYPDEPVMPQAGR